jgi:hypothetical protein
VSAEAGSASSYRFGAGPAGLWLGLGPGRLGVLGGGLVAAVTGLYLGVPIPVAVLPLLVAAAVVWLPVAGRPVAAWAPPAVGHAARGLAARTRWVAPLPVQRLTGRNDGYRLRLPAEYGRLRLHTEPLAGGAELAVLTDRGARTATVVLAVAGADRFPLLASAEQDRLIAGWGQALAALAGAGTRVRRLQWIEHAGPESRRDPVDWMRAHTDPVDRPDGRPAEVDDMDMGASDYPGFTDRLLAGAVRHRVFLAVQVDATSGGHSGSRRHSAGLDDAGGRDAGATRWATAAEVARHVVDLLLGAELVARPLGGAETAGLLAELLTSRPPTPARAAAVGPLSRRAGWDAVRVDDAQHRVFAVTGWPRLPVGPSWLEPLLLAAPAGAARTVSLHLVPVPAAAALRRSRSARARAELDRADRSRLGFVPTVGTDQAAADVLDAEAELVAGYATVRVAGLVAVTAASAAELDQAGRALRAAAALAHLDLAPLHGRHAQGLAACLPLCRLRPAGDG